MEEVISATSVTGTSWDDQLDENSDMDVLLSSDNIEETMPTLAEYTSISPPAPVGENNTILPNQQQTENQLRALIESFTGVDSMLDTIGTLPHQPEKTNQMMNTVEASWLGFDQSTIDTNEASNQPQDINNIIPVAEATWFADTVTDPNIVQANQQSWFAQIVNSNQYLLTNHLVQINQIIPVTDPSWLANQVPESSQTEPMDLSMPTAEPSWVGLGTEPVVNTNQVGPQTLQWEELVLVHPDQITTNQLEANDTTMPTADHSEASWEVPPYIQASLQSLNDPQISGQQPLEYTRNSSGPLATVEEAKPSNQAENATIAIPVITETNPTPKLITFRPGIYEGDEIPPLYSNISIIAAPSDEPQLPSLIYPELTIIPEPIPEDQIVTEPINPDVETTVDQNHLEKPLNNDMSVAVDEVEGSRQAVTDIVEQELPTNTSVPSTMTNSGYRSVDAKMLSTLRQMKLILIYKGFHYRRFLSLGKNICWRCVSRSCKAYLHSVGNKITRTYPHHNHLTQISQKPMNQEIKSKVALSLENADSNINNAGSSLNEAENDNMTSSHDCTSRRNTEENYDPSDALTSVSNLNNIIPNNPSLEITVKTPRAPNVTDFSTYFFDPLSICVPSYTHPVPNEASVLRNCSFCNGGIPSNVNHFMTVPKDTKVKVTISTKPRISKPLIYYDGKLAPPSNRRKKPPSLYSTNVPTTSHEGTIRTIDMTNAPSIFPPAPPGIPINLENKYAQDTNSKHTK